MTVAEQFHFGACQLDIPRRELLVAGRVQPVAPQVFALLCCLVEHSDRAVSKDELIERVWHGAEVSEGAIARAVMKARQAIGDADGERALIKTVHRVGYRFAGELRAVERSAARPPPSAGQMHVGLLPFDNGSGEPALDWTGHGLPTLVGQALEADRRITLIGAGAIAAALQALPLALTAAQRAAALVELLGAQCLVQATLHRSGTRLRLDYRSFGDLDLRGRLQGSEPTQLGARLAQVIEQGLFPAVQWPVAFISAQPLANEAFARAVEVGQREDWPEAARLLRTVLAVEPEHPAARLQYLRVLANLQDPAAIEFGQALLASAQAAGDGRTLAMAHEALGRVLINIDGDDHAARAAHHLDEALRLAAPHEGEDWVVRVHLGQAIKAHVRRDHAQALDFYERALRGCERSGNLMRRAVVLNNRSRAECCRGNLLVARELAEESLAICRRHQLIANAVDALSNLALIDANLGLFRRALRHVDQAIASIAALPGHEQGAVNWVLYIAGDLETEGLSQGLLQRALSQAHHAGVEQQPRDDATASASRAYERWQAGDSAAALAAMRQALDLSLASGFIENAHEFALSLLWLQLRAGDLAAAAALRAEAAQWPSWGDDTTLQAAALYAQAARQHGQGQADAARATLEAAAELAPAGRWRARAAVDAAWLHLEAGQIAPAQRLLRDHGAWLDEHPIGLATQARLLHASGRGERAAAVQRAALEADDTGALPWLRELLALYGAGATKLPPAPRLASLI